MGGVAVLARVSPYAALRLEKTRTMWACGRRGVSQASMSAWRFVPVHDRGGVNLGSEEGLDGGGGYYHTCSGDENGDAAWGVSVCVCGHDRLGQPRRARSVVVLAL